MHQQNIGPEDKTARRHFPLKRMQCTSITASHKAKLTSGLCYIRINTTSLHKHSCSPWHQVPSFRRDHLITSCVCWVAVVQAIHLQWVSSLDPKRSKQQVIPWETLIICNKILGQKTSLRPAWASFPDSFQKRREFIQIFGMNRN